MANYEAEIVSFKIEADRDQIVLELTCCRDALHLAERLFDKLKVRTTRERAAEIHAAIAQAMGNGGPVIS